MITVLNEGLANTSGSGSGNTVESSPGMQVQPNSYLVSGGRDKSIRLWDPLKGECIGVYNIHDNWVRGVVFHPSFKYIISCSDDRSIRILDIKESRCIRTIADAHSHFVTSIAIPPHGIINMPASVYKVIITGSVDKQIHVWGCS